VSVKRPGSPLRFHDTDSRRLTEAFFTLTPAKKSSSKKPFIIISLCCTALVGSFLYVAGTYQFIFVPRKILAGSETGLLTSDRLASLSFINAANAPAKTNGSTISVMVPREDKIGIVFNLAKPYNLRTNAIVFAIQNTAAPLLMDIVVKDASFHSTATRPLSFRLQTSKEASLTKIPVSFEPAKTPLVNFSQIKQIKVFFQYDHSSVQPTDIPLRIWKKQWVIIKDILLIEKEGSV